MTTSEDQPVEGMSNVTLTCLAKTSDIVSGYVWYKDNIQIMNATNMTFSLPNNDRNDEGHYSCEVITYKAPRSPRSENVTKNFLCKSRLSCGSLNH